MNDLTPKFTPDAADPRVDKIIKLAVMAVGGQGGGVLTGWIEKLARAQGYACQATSVAGVAQRTGATIYYVEMTPMGAAAPIFSLAPAAGDVDVLVAAELMEAGRAILRGFVTPDRTTLIASTHRALAVSEKTVPGDGISSAAEVIAAAEIAAAKFLRFDLEKLAVDNGSFISASLFGALAGSGALPFSRVAFEAAIGEDTPRARASLQAFGAAYAVVRGEAVIPDEPVKDSSPKPRVTGPDRALRDWQILTGRIAEMPPGVTPIATAGLRKVAEFQDVAYGGEYLDRVDAVLQKDTAEHGYRLSVEAAKYIANAMAYDDVIRVADRKTRRARFQRIRVEMQAGEQPLHLTEFMHPRAEEISGIFPAKLGQRVENSEKWMARLDRWFNKGRRIRSDSLCGFLMLHTLGGLRGYRRRTRRHAVEMAHLDQWLTDALHPVGAQYDLAVELIRCRRLIKGYSDTHARGLSKFGRVMAAAEQLDGREDAPDWIARLREAALQDEEGKALDGALQTIASFA